MSARSWLRAAPGQLVAPFRNRGFRRGAVRTVPAAVLPGSELLHLGGGEMIPCPGAESLPIAASARDLGLGLPSLALPQCRIHVLRDVVVAPGARLVRDGQGRVVAESLTGDMAERVHVHDDGRPPIEVDGPVAVYRSPWRGDAHTLVDHLPRAALLAQPVTHHLGRVTLLHDGPLDPFEELLLPRLLGNRADLLEVDPGRRVVAASVLLPSFVTRAGAGAIPSWYRRWVDRTASTLSGSAGPAHPRRLFVHGAEGDPRVGNRAALDGVLARHDVAPLDLSVLEPVEQVRALRNAELVVGLTGDGLSRAVFSRAAQVVELVPGGELSPHTYYLCASKGLPYEPVVASARDARPPGERFARQVSVDAAALDRVLTRLDASRSPAAG